MNGVDAGLADRDFTSKSDPACVLFTQDRQKKGKKQALISNGRN